MPATARDELPVNDPLTREPLPASHKVHVDGIMPGVRGPKFCSMKISHEISAMAREHGIDSARDIDEAMAAKVREFRELGGELYVEQEG